MLKQRKFSPIFGLLALFVLISILPVSASMMEIDFGLPLFGFDEVRLEKEKAPSFNFQLFKKYLSENPDQVIPHFHAIFSYVRLIKMSDDTKIEELKKLIRNFLKPADFNKENKIQILDYIFLSGLLLVSDKEDDPSNKRDAEFEEILLKADKTLEEVPEMCLVKGILFTLLRDRPNGYFAPMKPLEDLKRAAALAPADAHFQFVLGQAFRLMGSQEESLFHALVAYEKATSIDSGNHKLHNSLLGIYMGLHENYQGQGKAEPFWLEEAVYKKILTLSPNNPYALNNLGYLYAEFGVHKADAQIFCQRAVDQVPNNAGFRDSLGWAAFKNGQLDKAEAELSKSLSMNPDSFDTLYHLGTTYYVRKKYDKAISMYEKAVQIKPNAADALNNYAYLLSELDRDLEKGLQMARKAIALDPDNPSYLDTVGWIEFRLGNYEEAQRYLKKAFQLSPDVGEILAHLGKLYLQIKQFEKGLGFLKQAQKADPNLENIQNDIFFSMNLAALHEILGDYHKAFREKAQTKHLMSILLQIARLYQDEGLFNQAIVANQLCEKLKRGELDLAKPIFDFYELPVATPSTVIGTGPAQVKGEPVDAGQETGAEKVEVASETVFPDMPDVPLALNVGPGVFRSLAKRLNAFPGFEALSATLIMRDSLHPYSRTVFQFQCPGWENREVLKAIEFYLSFYGVKIADDQKNKEFKGFRGMFGQYPFWVMKDKEFVLIGMEGVPGAAEVKILKNTFSYDEKRDLGLFLNWSQAVKFLPEFLIPFMGNPLGNFDRVFSEYSREGGSLLEKTLLVPLKKIDKEFMKEMADLLYQYKVILLHFGCTSEISVEANDGCVMLKVDYTGIRDALRALKERVGFLALLIKPFYDEGRCILRRAMFGKSVNNLEAICPSNGKVVMNSSTGGLCCSFHGRFNLIYPLLGFSDDRCECTRNRLSGLVSLFSLKYLEKDKIEGLIKMMLLDYNIPPCPRGGNYVFENGSVQCSFHKSDGASTLEKKDSGQ